MKDIREMTREKIGNIMELDRKTVSKKYNNFIKDLRKVMKEKNVR